jgi:hypothetical protein
MARTPLGRDERRRRQSQRVGAVGFLAASALPWLLFHRVIGRIAAGFRLDLNYFVSELSPWLLIGLGILLLAPVALSAGRDPSSRLYPAARPAYLGWGITLYLLGLALATQVAQISATGAG